MVKEKTDREVAEKHILKPVFIIGCGRSGTTLLGELLSKHPDVLFLNEPRELWFSAYPETDIWSKNAEVHNGRLYLNESDEISYKSAKLRSLFYNELVRKKKKLLIEKTPINCFRLALIDRIFKNAKYIHIFRNGIDVAKSIELRCRVGKWYGINNYKWKQIENYAALNKSTKENIEKCDGFFEKGLLEWRLCTESAVNFLYQTPKNRFIEISYKKLKQQPDYSARRVLSFLNLKPNPSIIKFAKNTIINKEDNSLTNINKTHKMIGGLFLEKLINNNDLDGFVE